MDFGLRRHAKQEAVLIFYQLRKSMKWVIVVVCFAFVVSLLYMGGSFFFGGRSGDSVLAKVNGATISHSEFQQDFLNQLQQYEAQYGHLAGPQIEQVKLATLQGLVNQTLALQLADKNGIKVSDSAVNDQIKKIQDQFASKDQFNQVLQQQHLTMSQLQDDIRRQLKLQNLQDAESKVTISDDDVKRAYESVNVDAVLFSASGDAKDPSWAKAESKAKEAKGKLDKGTSWSDIVKAYGSKDEQANGGALGWIHHSDQYPAELINAAFGLKKGQIAGPIKTAQGYYVIKVTDRKDASGPDFDKAKADLKTQLEQSAAQQKFSQWFDGERQKAKIKVNDPELQALQFMSTGQNPQAVSYFEQAIAADSSNATLHWMLAEALNSVKDPQRALGEYEQAAKLDASDYQLQIALGQQYQQLKQNDKAAAAFEQASKLAGQSGQQSYFAHAELEQLFTQLGDKTQAADEQKILDAIQKQLEAQAKAQQQQNAASGSSSSGSGASTSGSAAKTPSSGSTSAAGTTSTTSSKK